MPRARRVSISTRSFGRSWSILLRRKSRPRFEKKSKPKPRRQHVMLRSRRKEELKTRLRTVVWRSVGFAVAAGFMLGMVAGGDSFLGRFMRQHTPALIVSAPAAMSALPLQQELPSHAFLLWFPGMATRAVGR